MRVVTRPDFDGIVCAVLLKEAESIDEPIYWIQPGDLADQPLAHLARIHGLPGPRKKRMALLTQSTQPPWKFERLAGFLTTRAHELKIVNTVCPVTIWRQQDTTDLAQAVDLVVVVGGRNSANTKELTRLVGIVGKPAVQIEHARDLEDASTFEGYTVVGVTSRGFTGASVGLSPEVYVPLGAYELIVNEDDDANADNIRSKQGTLRQFIKNSNAILGVNKSWFQIP